MSSAEVSVVLATRDRLASLRRCLGTLRAQAHAEGIELIVVDDASSDGTPGYLEGLAREGAIVCLHGGGRGPAAARNLGIRAARGEMVALTDDDCELPADWAARLASRLVESGAVAVGGRVVAADGVSLPARLSQALTNGVVEAINRDPATAAFLTSNNVAYRCGALVAAGLFDESFGAPGGEERELHRRLLGCGRLVYAPEIVVQHRPAIGWRGLVRQQAGYGRGARRYREKGGRPLSGAERLRMLGAAWHELSPRDRPALLLGWPLSQAAVAWGYLRA